MTEASSSQNHALRLRRMGIDTYQEPVIYMRHDCDVCKAEGFEAHTRVRVECDGRFLIATLNVVHSELLQPHEAGLSEAAWRYFGAKPGDPISVSHPDPLPSLSHVRSKIYGRKFSAGQIHDVIRDVAQGLYADVHLASLITACAGNRMTHDEIADMTKAMVAVGQTLRWPGAPVMDKHCVGGLPANRTTLLIVPIVAAFGLTIPKTSSRSITSPAGTADTMEVLAPVALSVEQMRRVVEREGGCVIWGGSLRLSPADDILIRVERVLDLDSEGQMIASVLSKKAAAGSTHVIIDIPHGPTAKVRDPRFLGILTNLFQDVGREVGLHVKVIITDGSQPVGRGIGPALEARDVLQVLQNDPGAPADLREKSLFLAGHLLEFSGRVPEGEGYGIAKSILLDGRAWKKFQAIAEAQGGLRAVPAAEHRHVITAAHAGVARSIDNRRLSMAAKLAGAPRDPAAGVDFHVTLDQSLERGQPLYTIHASSRGELRYALQYARSQTDIVRLEPA